jgi:hypothetical protein
VTLDPARLPRKTLRAGTRLYRIHRPRNGPWFFSRGPGRFDPTGVAGRGACYWAEDELGAWVEALRTRMLLPESELAQRRLSIATLSADAVVSDLTVRRALRGGVTAAVSSGADYRESQGLADALQDKRAGVRWRARHDLRQKLVGVAWFGPEGPASRTAVHNLPATVTLEIPAELIPRACRTFGYEVLPNPPT